MKSISTGVDVYIDKLPDFSKKILTRLRQLIHQVDPAITEDLRWGSPTYFKKKSVFLTWGMKNHASIIFQQGALLKDSKKLFNDGLDNQKSRVIKFSDVSEVEKIKKDLLEYIKEAIKNDEAGKKIILQKKERKPIVIPADIKQLLRDKNLLDKFYERPYYQQRDYLHWITSPKRSETSLKRMVQMIEDLQHGGDHYMGMVI